MVFRFSTEKLKLDRQAYIVLVLLSLNALLKSLKFGEAYLTPYLTDVKGLTKEQVYDLVLPVWTYSFLAFLVPVSFFSHWLGGFRGLIWITGITDALAYGLFAWGEGLLAMQFAEASFGCTTAASIGFFAALTELLPKESRAFANALLRSILLIGHLLGSLGAHVFLKFGLPMQYLYIISFVCLVVAFVITTVLPKRREYMEIPESEISELDEISSELSSMPSPTSIDKCPIEKFQLEPCTIEKPTPLSSFIVLLKTCYPSIDMIVIGNTSSLVYAAFILGETNIPSVWFEFGKQHEAYVNGIMDTIGRSAAALTVFGVGFLPVSLSSSAQMPIALSVGWLMMAMFGIAYGLTLDSLILAAFGYVAMMSFGYGLIAYFTGIMAHTFKNTREFSLFMGIQCIVSVTLQSIIVAIISNYKSFVPLAGRYNIFAGILSLGLLLMSINMLRKEKFNLFCK